MSRALRIDLKRAFISWEFFFSILLGAAICYFTLLFCGNYQSETVDKFIMLHDRGQSFLAYIAGILPFSLCFYSDLKYNNLKNMVGRIKLTTYILSKNIAAIISSVSAFVIGKMLFVYSYSLFRPVCLPQTLDRLPLDMIYFELLEKGNYISYFLLSSFQKSLYCAFLCQLVMLVSLCIPNKSVIYSIPIAAFYILNFYVSSRIKTQFLNFSRVFDGVTRIMESDRGCFLYALFWAVVLYGILYWLMYYCMRKKVFHE